MEGITEIDKTKYIDECKEIVRNEIPEELSDEMLTIVTNEIMDTCLFIGGDFKKENIIDCGICSVCNSDLIHSYRVEKEKYGLSTAIIGLK